MIPKIKELEEYKKDSVHPFNEQSIYEFENGLKVSVISGEYTYGIEMMLLWDHENKSFENQIKELDEDLFYDVVGYLNEEKMKRLLLGIKNIK